MNQESGEGSRQLEFLLHGLEGGIVRSDECHRNSHHLHSHRRVGSVILRYSGRIGQSLLAAGVVVFDSLESEAFESEPFDALPSSEPPPSEPPPLGTAFFLP